MTLKIDKDKLPDMRKTIKITLYEGAKEKEFKYSKRYIRPDYDGRLFESDDKVAWVECEVVGD